MKKNQPQSIFYVFYVSIIVALGGFLMGFDASVISGVVKFIEPEFNLTKIQLGWAVASLSLTAISPIPIQEEPKCRKKEIQRLFERPCERYPICFSGDI